MRTRIFILVVVLNALIWGILAYNPASSAQAASWPRCPATYVVQRGDWLAAIARRFNTSVSELLYLNPQLRWRWNLIFPGETLCLPGTGQQPTPPTPQSGVPNLLSLEATYTVQPSDIPTYTLSSPMNVLGRREVLPIVSDQGVQILVSPDKVSNALSGQSGPFLLAYRNGESGSDYTLIEVGSTNILSDLRLNPGQALALPPSCGSSPIQTAYNMPADKPMSLKAWIETNGGTRFPFEITQVGTAAQLSECQRETGLIAFVLVPAVAANPNEHRLYLRAVNPSPNFGDDLRFICGIFGSAGQYVCGYF